jgi:acyl-coenzyme A thioesterase PaaI-like protein
VLKPGKNFHFCEAEIFELENNEKKLIAKASSTMAVVRDKNFKDKYSE